MLFWTYSSILNALVSSCQGVVIERLHCALKTAMTLYWCPHVRKLY